MDNKPLRPYEKKNTLEHWIIWTFEHWIIGTLEHWNIQHSISFNLHLVTSNALILFEWLRVTLVNINCINGLSENLKKWVAAAELIRLWGRWPLSKQSMRTLYISSIWEPQFMTIIVIWQVRLRVTLNGIRNSYDVYITWCFRNVLIIRSSLTPDSFATSFRSQTLGMFSWWNAGGGGVFRGRPCLGNSSD